MMTAGHIASGLGQKDVTINYRASDALLRMFYEEDPMCKLKSSLVHTYQPDRTIFTEEHMLYKFDFGQIMEENWQFPSKGYFPKTVDFKEPRLPADFKREIFEAYPERDGPALTRGISLLEVLNRRIQAEGRGGKRICYLIVSHAMHVDVVGHLLEILEGDRDVLGHLAQDFGNLTKD